MPTAVLFALLIATPAACFWLFGKAFDVFTAWERPGRRPPPKPSINRLGADLHRLDREYNTVLRSNVTGKVVRLRALAAAYDETLLACCDHFGLEIAHTSPLSGTERLELEAALSQRGLTW